MMDSCEDRLSCLVNSHESSSPWRKNVDQALEHGFQLQLHLLLLGLMGCQKISIDSSSDAVTSLYLLSCDSFNVLKTHS